MKISRYRSSNIITIAIITIALGILLGFIAGALSSIKMGTTVISAFNWANALIVFVPLLAAGMILLGLAQFASLSEDIDAKNNEEQEVYKGEP